jgi:hypothetical protein
MDKSEDFEGLAKHIMQSSMQGQGDQYFALGRYKILMMPEARTVLEKCKEKAARERNLSAAVLKRAFNVYFGAIGAKKRKIHMECVQARYKLIYHKKQKQWADQFA